MTEPKRLRGDETPEELAALLIDTSPLSAADIAKGIEVAALHGLLEMPALVKMVQEWMDCQAQKGNTA